MYFKIFLLVYILIYFVILIKCKSQIKVSIIMPTYNGASYLNRSINSILNQTLREIELIIVNDCSTDKTINILSKYSNDNRVKIINLNKNTGQGNARNKGIKLARGEFIGFMDDDDYVDERFHERLYYYSKDKDIVVGTFLDCISDSQYCSYNKEQEYYDSTIVDKNNYKKKRVYGFVVNSIWRRSFLKENNLLFPIKRGILEDKYFRIKCYEKKPRIIKIPDEGIYYYYERRRNSSHKVKKRFMKYLRKKIKINKLENKGFKINVF